MTNYFETSGLADALSDGTRRFWPVAERPMIFSGPMVRAILAGTKTQTRRVVKPQGPMQPECWDNCVVQHGHGHSGLGWYAWDDGCEDDGAHPMRCPYGQPGDLLWVRETHAPQADCWGSWERWARGEGGAAPVIHYAADAEPSPFIERWRPSIHMPRWASRITLRVTDVRVERLQEITANDARAEGCPDKPVPGAERASVDLLARLWFHDLWEAINGAGSWGANPWVWVVSFERVGSSPATTPPRPAAAPPSPRHAGLRT